MTDFFKDIPKIRFEGTDGGDLAYRHYDRDEILLGKRMEDHLRFSLA
ncbi:MAG: xylose isomerase, partial [Pseudomonadota bacterium]